MSTPEYTKPAWAPECPWKDHPGYSSQTSERRIGWEAVEAAIYAAMERAIKEHADAITEGPRLRNIPLNEIPSED